MSTAVEQLPLFPRLPVPKLRAADQPRLWLPVSWRRAVNTLMHLRQLELHLPMRRASQKRIKFTIDPATLPYAVKPSKVIWMIQTAPPPTPMCFDSTQQWQEYLMYLHADGTAITRRQDLGKNAKHGVRVVTTVFDRIDFCADCDFGGDRQRRMSTEGRCILPPKVTETLPVKEHA